MHHLIVGNGAAGVAAARAIRGIDPNAEITLLGDEAHPPYYRPLVPMLISGERSSADLYRNKADLDGLASMAGVRVTKVDISGKSVTLSHGRATKYDRILLATGASPSHLNVPGAKGPGVFFLRSLDDAEAIAQTARGAKKAVVVGGGRVGCKAAVALHELGMDVTIVEKLDRLIPLQLDSDASALLQEALGRLGIRVLTGQGIKSVLRNNGAPRGVLLDDGSTLPCDLVLVAVGVRPNVDLASQAGINVDRGIVVDGRMRTSAPDVYAAGDAVQTVDSVSGQVMVSGIWTNAVEMGRTAGANMAGADQEAPSPLSVLNAMEIGDLPFICAGIVQPGAGNGYEVVVEKHERSYRKFVFRDDMLVGVLLVGNIDHAGVFTSLLRQKTRLGPLKNLLTTPGFSYAPFLKIGRAKVEGPSSRREENDVRKSQN
ncbi:MAG: NAD(P)/FAD-dependent oxidoreductase [Chloroflexi bacterium]|nr:NAD(P)/FAD-dependent oxidoreductase [Chloroflexota bacterium]